MNEPKIQFDLIIISRLNLLRFKTFIFHCKLVVKRNENKIETRSISHIKNEYKIVH